MKRFSRRLLGAMLGLVLGWWLAGLVGDRLSGASVSLAENPHAAANQPAEPGGKHAAARNDHEHEAGDAGHGHEAFADPGFVPGAGQTDWYRGVLWAIGGLFVAAIVIGVPRMKLKSDEPAAAAASPDDGHH